MKKMRKITPSKAVIFIAMCVMTVSFLYPLYFMLTNAMKTKSEYYLGQFTLPSSLNFSNFKSIVIDFHIFTYFGNSMIVSAASTLLIILFATFASYAFAKLRFKGKNVVYMLILATMFMPGQVSMIPAYVMFSKFGLMNSFWSVILAYLAGGLPGAILLMRGTFHGISNEVIESAKIDGAGYFTVIRNIILPMGMSAIAIVVIFNFINDWNDLLTPMLYLTDDSKKTVMVALTALVQKTSSLPTRQMAGLLLSILPAVLIYLFLQKYLIKGVTAGAIK